MPIGNGPEIKDTLKHLDRLDAEGRARLKERDNGQWASYIEEFRGNQWRGTGKPMFLANLIGPAIDRRVAYVTESKPVIKITPRRRGLSETAKYINDTIDAGWDEYSMEMVLEDLQYYVSLMGSGFCKLPWDSRANFGMGDCVPCALDPRTVRYDPMITRSQDISKAGYVIMDSIAPLWDIWAQYPGVGQLVKADPRLSAVSDGSNPSMIRRVSQSVTKIFTGQTESEGMPRAYLREYWFKTPELDDKGSPRYPFGRHIIRGGDDVILKDEANPYWDGMWDIVMMDGKPDPEHADGRSEVDALRRIQESFNRMGHAFVENAILTGNAWITADSDALEPDAINRLNNMGAIVLTKRFGRTIDRQPPPQMPSHFMDFMRLGMQLVDVLMGNSDNQMQGKGRVELRSGSQIEGLQMAAQTLVRASARRMESFLQRLGQLWISRIFQFYSTDRMMTFLGPGQEWMTFEFQRQELVKAIRQEALTEAQEDRKKRGLNTFDAAFFKQELEKRFRGAWRDFRFKVTPGSSLAMSKTQQALMFAQLAQQGMVPRVKVLEALGMPNSKELIEQAMEEAKHFPPPPPPKKQKASG